MGCGLLVGLAVGCRRPLGLRVRAAPLRCKVSSELERHVLAAGGSLPRTPLPAAIAAASLEPISDALYNVVREMAGTAPLAVTIFEALKRHPPPTCSALTSLAERLGRSAGSALTPSKPSLCPAVHSEPRTTCSSSSRRCTGLSSSRLLRPPSRNSLS